MSSPRFCRSFLCGYALILGGLAWSTRAVHTRLFRHDFSRITEDLPRGLFDPTVLSAGEAKERGLFWLYDTPDTGAAMNLLSSPEEFEAVFPGYEAARLDGGFWNRYFRLPFDSVVVAENLSRNEGKTMVSWAGNLELFAARGADLVFLGSSEVFHAVIPERLSTALEEGRLVPGGRPKVLSLGIGAMSPAAVRLAAKAMAESGRKTRFVLWGYSYWNAFRSPNYESNLETVRAALTARTAKPGKSAREIWELAHRWKWDAVLGLNLQSEWDRRRGDPHPGVGFPTAALRRPGGLAEAAGAMTPREDAMAGAAERDCDLGRASGELRAAIAELSRVSDRVFLYLPPTTALHTSAAPACFLPAVRRMLLAQAGPRVRVLADDWKAYGLDYRDFVKRSTQEGRSWIDVDHPNLGGAGKVTRRIASWMAESAQTHVAK